jgi:hypothetical protein
MKGMRFLSVAVELIWAVPCPAQTADVHQVGGRRLCPTERVHRSITGAREREGQGAEHAASQRRDDGKYGCRSDAPRQRRRGGCPGHPQPDSAAVCGVRRIRRDCGHSHRPWGAVRLSRPEGGYAPILFAARQGQTAVVELLVPKGRPLASGAIRAGRLSISRPPRAASSSWRVFS